MRIIVLNPGSSTLKASLVASDDEQVNALTLDWPPGDDDPTEIVQAALGHLPREADAMGYRVVHGGVRRAASLVDADLLEEVERLDRLAPLHNRRAAAAIRAGSVARPDIPHVACFDTAFHADLPEAAWRYPLPSEWVETWGIRRFGFHGLSLAWATRRASELLGRAAPDLRLVIAHLGSGCSVTAIEGGRSIDTSMGYTPYEGLMMGTRSGSVDPGIILDLMRRGVTADALADGLGHRSGLLAVAGVAGAREIESRAADGDSAAILALEMFARRAAAAIAAASTALTDLDAVVFTGGIGAASAGVRADILQRLGGLGLPNAAEAVNGDTVAAAGPPAVVVVTAREDLVIASEVAALLEA